MSEMLDRLIDDTARSLTDAPRPGDFRARVLSRIHSAGPESSRTRWLIPGAAIATACIALVVYFGGQRQGVQDVRLKPDTTAVQQGVQLKPDTTAVQQDVRLKPDTTTATVTSAATGSAADPPQIVLMPPPPGFERLTVDPVNDQALASIAMIQVEPIPIDSLEIDSLNTLGTQ